MASSSTIMMRFIVFFLAVWPPEPTVAMREAMDDENAFMYRAKRPPRTSNKMPKTQFTEEEAGRISRNLAECEFSKKQSGRFEMQVGDIFALNLNTSS